MSSNLAIPMSKKCYHCQVTDEELFAPSQRYSCRKCTNEYSRANYRQNKTKIIEQSKARNIERIQKCRQYVLDILRSSCCIDCGEEDPVVLEFDHVRGTKKKSVSELIMVASSIRTVQAEIDKCELVCANCHRKRTAARAGNWYRTLIEVI